MGSRIQKNGVGVEVDDRFVGKNAERVSVAVECVNRVGRPVDDSVSELLDGRLRIVAEVV